jgi:hypothetical protein
VLHLLAVVTQRSTVPMLVIHAILCIRVPYITVSHCIASALLCYIMKQSGFLTVATFALQSALKVTLKDKDTLQEYIVCRVARSRNYFPAST